MKFSIFTPVYLLALITATSAASFPITHTTTLNCREKASTSSTIKRTYTTSSSLTITCQTTGPTINGNNIWDKTSDGCFVADYYVKTGTNGFIKGVPKCPGTPAPKPPPSSAKVPGPRKDDYKFKGNCGGGPDPWRYFKCQCTSFVAQRINERLGVKFTNNYKGVKWGDAKGWDSSARAAGVKINSTPKPGSIAQTRNGAGHVAWVSAVQGDFVTVEEYNFATRERYGTRKVKKSTFKYIHLTSST